METRVAAFGKSPFSRSFDLTYQSSSFSICVLVVEGEVRWPLTASQMKAYGALRSAHENLTPKTWLALLSSPQWKYKLVGFVWWVNCSKEYNNSKSFPYNILTFLELNMMVTFQFEIFKTRMLWIYFIINSVKMEIWRGKPKMFLIKVDKLIISGTWKTEKKKIQYSQKVFRFFK